MTADPDVQVSELLKVMAHDLRNPLSALVTNLHFLRGAVPVLDNDSREALADSVSLCDVLERLITNLDIVARSEQEKPKNRFPTSLRQVAQTIVQRNQHQAISAGLELLFVPGEGGDPLVVVEREMFSRAAENLVANALEHAPANSQVKVEVTLGGGEAAIVVTDSAPPVPAELRKQAVSMAGQSRHMRRAEARYGRGLGLLCADLAARAAGARLELDGQPSQSVLRLVAPLG
jgi:two-component system heavy metal sensor histidine kinase CusS